MALTRRDFIRSSCCTAAALGIATNLSRFGLVHALAQSAPPPYQALVCIFLFGGNDSNNLLIPNDTAGYANYANIRGSQTNGGLALAQNTLLPITSKTAAEWQTAFGLHPSAAGIADSLHQRPTRFSGQCGHAVAARHANAISGARSSRAGEPLLPCRPAATVADASIGWILQERMGGPHGRQRRAVIQCKFRIPADHFGGRFGDFRHRAKDQALRNHSGDNAGTYRFTAPRRSARLEALQQLLTFDTGVSLIQATSSITSNSLADSKILSGALDPRANDNDAVSRRQWGTVWRAN